MKINGRNRKIVVTISKKTNLTRREDLIDVEARWENITFLFSFFFFIPNEEKGKRRKEKKWKSKFLSRESNRSFHRDLSSIVIDLSSSSSSIDPFIHTRSRLRTIKCTFDFIHLWISQDRRRRRRPFRFNDNVYSVDAKMWGGNEGKKLKERNKENKKRKK